MTQIEVIELMQSALRYYADGSSWELYLDGAGNHGTDCDATTNDRGRRARQALAKLKASLEEQKGLPDLLPQNTETKHPTQIPTP